MTGVNPSRTSKVEIGRLVIERNLRSRRKHVVEKEETVKVVRCGFRRKPAVVRLRDLKTGREQVACESHGNLLTESCKWAELGADL